MAVINGTTGIDTIVGTFDADEIHGLAGNDKINSGGGNDIVYGDEGNDNINGEAGDDTIYGGLGNDTLTGDAGKDTLYGGDGDDGFFGGGGDDTIYGEAGNDTIYGDGSNDTIWGGAGVNKLNGGVGNDTFVVVAGQGSDTIVGGAGIDTLDLRLTSAQVTSALKSDMANYKSYMDTQLASNGGVSGMSALATGTTFTFTSLGLTLSVTENILISVDGKSVPLSSFLNSAPTAASTVSVATAEDTVLSSQISAVDVDGDTLAYALTQGPAHGTLTLNANTGAYTYVPNANYFGGDNFQVSVSDGKGGTISQSVLVSVAAVNDGPVAEASVSLSADEDTAVSGQVMASDIEADTLAFSLANGPANGTVSLNAATGAYTYTPGANFNGGDSFQVSVSDGQGGSVVQTVSVGIAAVNDGPVAAASVSLSTNEDTAVSGQVVASDIDGDTLSYAVANGPANGTVSLNSATGGYSYKGAANYSGNDQFSVKVTDNNGGWTTQFVNVGIAAVADAPALTVANVQNVATGITLNGTTGNDTLTGTAGNDKIYGGSGDDTIYGGGAAQSKTVALNIAAALTDTDGSETLSLRVTGVPASATLSAGTRNLDGSWSLTTAQLAGLSLTAATSTDLTLTVAATSTEATGGSATKSSTLSISYDRGTDSDYIDGGAGNDKLYGGAGANTLIDGDGNDFAYGNGGNDLFIAGAGNDTLDGGIGFDILDMSNANLGVVVDLAKGTAIGLGIDKVLNFEGIAGSAYNDILTGSSVDSAIWGGKGDDKIAGGAGNDKLDGGEGNDNIDGGSGNDVLSDGNGDDYVAGGSGDDLFLAGDGSDKYVGGSGFDVLDYSNATRAINVDASKKTVTGYTDDKTDGIEKYVGTGFDDNFKGGKTANYFDGGAGNDTFRGMGGSDVYTGGKGADQFIWYVKDVVTASGNSLGADYITDFNSDDKLNLREFTKAYPGASVDSLVHITDTAGGSLISVKHSTGYVDLVVLQDVHGITAAGLLSAGMIIV